MIGIWDPCRLERNLKNTYICISFIVTTTRHSLFLVACLLLLHVAVAQHDQDQSNNLNSRSGLPPILTGISGCQHQSNVQTFDCPRPVVLTLTGTGFLTDTDGFDGVWFMLDVDLIDSINSQTYQCDINKSLLLDTQIICTIKSAGYGGIASNTWMDITFTNLRSRNTTSLINAVSFVTEPTPRVDRISGCQIISSDGQSASRCDFVNDHITLHGSAFLSIAETSTSVTLGSDSFYMDMFMLVRCTDTQMVLSGS